MEIKTAPLGNMAANFYIVTDEVTNEMFVVDPGDCPEIACDLIKSTGMSLKYIFITHAHADHIGALDALKNQFDAPVVIYSDEADALNDTNATLCNVFSFPAPITKADIKVTEQSCLPFGNTKITFIHTPGHTKGSMCIKLDNVLFSGDTLFELSVGRCDFPGGDFFEIENSIKNKLYSLPPETKVYPGHGNPTTVGFEKENNPFVRG